MNYDRKRTIKNVSSFFGDPTAINSSSEFKDLIDLAHLTSNDLMYHSPVISDMPKATSFGNHTEDATIRLMEKMSESEIAKWKIQCILKAIRNMDGRFGNLLFNRHFRNMTFDELADLTGYSSANLSKLLNTAYLKLALWTVDELDLIVSVDNQ
ncbi:hypothetical protein [Leuconostoc mesenteroides]|uniref:hypothetical protein n=1 Tax=Leuconostoc mesenteroides TaxID=1245 RepID=UPI001FAA55D5|nr:hypothetical protein [Leuconostoc mesenteroides]